MEKIFLYFCSQLEWGSVVVFRCSFRGGFQQIFQYLVWMLRFQEVLGFEREFRWVFLGFGFGLGIYLGFDFWVLSVIRVLRSSGLVFYEFFIGFNILVWYILFFLQRILSLWLGQFLGWDMEEDQRLNKGLVFVVFIRRILISFQVLKLVVGKGCLCFRCFGVCYLVFGI